MKIFFSLVILVLFCLHFGHPTLEPNEYVDYINNLKTTWKANLHARKSYPPEASLGAILHYPVPEPLKESDLRETPPETFDSRDKWPYCSDIISHVRDQGECGSCWAIASVSSISDRICIASEGKKKVLISGEHLLSCCGRFCGHGCFGGYPLNAFYYYQLNGLVSGGDYNDTKTCLPYSLEPCEHHIEGPRKKCGSFRETPKCRHVCQADYNTSFNSDLHYGLNAKQLASGPLSLKYEIWKNGPVTASFRVHDDFFLYKSGVYKHTEKSKIVGGHSVKIIGWGYENDVPYWLAVNSWNTDWGDNGFFKILRNENECEIEDHFYSAHARLD